MKCQYRKCSADAEYHIKNGKTLCYDHTVQSVGYNPSTLDKCKCCGLMTPRIPVHNVPKKRLKEIDLPKGSGGGENSLYWDFSNAHCSPNSEGSIEENVFANPDIFTEDDHPYHRPLSERGEVQFQALQEVIKDLSPQQQRVLYLCGQLGKSQDEAAKELGVQPPAVCKMLQRIQIIVQAKYKTLMEQEYER
jgi:hypothetical protein